LVFERSLFFSSHSYDLFIGQISMAKINKPTKPALWSSAKSQARAKFDVYPSAYANAWAAKKYKAMGGGWRTVSAKKAKRKKK